MHSVLCPRLVTVKHLPLEAEMMENWAVLVASPLDLQLQNTRKADWLLKAAKAQYCKMSSLDTMLNMQHL